MGIVKVYSISVRDAQLGSPAQSSDRTDGFVKYSFDGRTHSIKSETTFAECTCQLVLDDSMWEIYEGTTGNPILLDRASGTAYNMISDVVLSKKNDVFSIELVSGDIQPNHKSVGLKIEPLSSRAIDVAGLLY